MTSKHSPGNNIGKSMLIAAWVILLVGLTLAFGSWEEQQYNPNSSIEGSESTTHRAVTLERNRFNSYIATGTINGKPTVFLLDTGATDVVVPQQLAKQLGLKFGTKGIAMTANGAVEVFATQITLLELGPIQLENVRASINPAMHDMEVLLGMSALKNLDFQQSGDQLTLTQFTR